MSKEMKYAGFWVRLNAEGVDSTLLTIGATVLELMILGVVYWMGGVKGPLEDAFNPAMLQILNLALYALLAFPYYTWGHYRYGTTLGKRYGISLLTLGRYSAPVYVVSASDGLPITLKQAIIRSLGYVLSYIPLMAGFFMAAFHPKKQCLHDLMAGTVSVVEKRG